MGTSTLHKDQGRTVAGLYKEVTPGAGVLPDVVKYGNPIAFYIGGTAGNLVVTQGDGSTVTLPVTSFQTLPCNASIVTAASSATPIYAIY